MVVAVYLSLSFPFISSLRKRRKARESACCTVYTARHCLSPRRVLKKKGEGKKIKNLQNRMLNFLRDEFSFYYAYARKVIADTNEEKKANLMYTIG